MNKIKFIVRDIDIAPIPGAKVHVAGASAPAGDPTTDTNGVTPPLQLTASTFGYKVTHPDYAEDVGGGSFSVTASAPSGSIAKGQVLSMKWYDLGGDNVVEVCVILGKIAPPLNTGCWVQEWKSLDAPLTPIHGTGTTGWSRFNATHVPQAGSPPGEYLTCEVIGLGTPRLVAIWRPAAVDLKANQPVNFLVYFHPFRPPKGPYPFDPDYVQVGQSYLGNPRRTISHMAQQGISAIGVVPIFPLDNPGLYEHVTATQVYRLIREVNFFLQMRAGAQLLSQWRVKQVVGKVAACCFSRSVIAVGSMLSQRGVDPPKAAEFLDQKLREVYALDPIPEQASQFMASVVSWFRKGADGRRFRLYTEFDGWVDAFASRKSDLASGPVTHSSWQTGPGASSEEWHGPDESFTFFHCNKDFVQPVVDIIHGGGAPSLDADPGMQVHSFFPGYFLGHALRNSSLK